MPNKLPKKPLPPVRKIELAMFIIYYVIVCFTKVVFFTNFAISCHVSQRCGTQHLLKLNLVMP